MEHIDDLNEDDLPLTWAEKNADGLRVLDNRPSVDDGCIEQEVPKLPSDTNMQTKVPIRKVYLMAEWYCYLQGFLSTFMGM